MRTYLLALAVMLTAACSSGDKASRSESTAKTTVQTEEATDTPSIAVAAASRHVACGCAIEGIGACGNYIEIDGKFVYIANWADFGLGAMEWCGKDSVTVEASGEIRDGEFFAATLEEIPGS